MISGAVRQDLIARYREPHRAYHTMVHIEDCLTQVETSTDLSQADHDLLTLAVWFHDAIYDPTRGDNEAESARLAVQTLTVEEYSPADIAEVQRLILLTAGHIVEPADALGARLVSIDLSILGAEPAAYDAYADAIRFEYDHVPDALYRPGRAAVMGRFLEAEILFPDPIWAARLDQQARANLRREIAALTA